VTLDRNSPPLMEPEVSLSYVPISSPMISVPSQTNPTHILPPFSLWTVTPYILSSKSHAHCPLPMSIQKIHLSLAPRATFVVTMLWKNAQAGGPLLVTYLSLLIQCVCSYFLCLGVISSISNLRMQRNVVTRNPLNITLSCILNIFKTFLLLQMEQTRIIVSLIKERHNSIQTEHLCLITLINYKCITSMNYTKFAHKMCLKKILLQNPQPSWLLMFP
jgi:hypothetical protein